MRSTTGVPGRGAPDERFFVLTGGPGSGKTTILDELAARGMAVTREAGRGIIQDQVLVGGPALPWADPALFAELMLCWELRSYRAAAEEAGPVFFDRGTPDVLGYLRLSGARVPPHVQRAAREVPYHRLVFVTPYWPEIFHHDAERRQDHAEAERTCEVMLAVYRELGYETVLVPRGTPAERADFVLERVHDQRPAPCEVAGHGERAESPPALP
ncbi:AAA family ATPase [Actinoalloteichus caeruleus]|uniref:ATPase n=1 Tax=Actinoalloteichus caeruleus DSM 43889 TaxID=1120930 RepID=A0ABT1JJT0_ACTCY|nr:AAA family ATPase [Actinoalloteichus caeruleus]MCP2332554.1 putative ATPase [Actinoalloteichus caeruleus DSM 43889]